MNEPPAQGEPDRGRRGGVLLALLLAAGFLLRSCGLSHDFDLGRVHHPDAPKQIAAAANFLDGVLYFRHGHPDFDGYPYFFSHLLAGVYRGVDAADRAWRFLTGMHTASGTPRLTALYWIAMWLNVVLSTAVIALVYRIGRAIFGRAEALLGALLVTVSPIAIAASHYQTNDVSAGFFATLTALFACRIYLRGRLWDYAAGAACVVFAFATKYHGILAGVACATAHVMRGGVRGAFSRRALGPLAVAAGAAVAALPIAVPALFVNAVDQMADIRAFLSYTSNFGIALKAEELSWLGRWLHGLAYTFPTFLAILGPVLLPLLLVGIPIEIWRTPRTLVVALFPICYVLFGLAFKPQAFPVHHLVITPLLFLLAGRLIVRVWRWERWRPLPRAAAVVIAVAALGIQAVRAYEEDFYFRRNDVKLVLNRWVRDNIPPSFTVWCPDYPTGAILELPFDSGRPWRDIDNLMVFSPAIPDITAPDCVLRQTFWLRDRSVIGFRNVPIEAGLYCPRLMRAGWMRPVFPCAPSEGSSDVVLAGEQTFYRSGELLWLEGRTEEKVLFTEQKVNDALVVLRCGDTPSTATVDFGGVKGERTLAPGESAVIPIRSPRGCLPPREGRHAYRIKGRSTWGRVAVHVAITPQEKGTTLFNAGHYAEALPHLRAAVAREDNPTLRVMAALARREAGRGGGAPADAPVQAFAAGDWTPERLWATYGIAEAYLTQLPFVSHTGEQMLLGHEGDREMHSPEMILDPGAYRLAVDLASPPDGMKATGAVSVAVADARFGNPLAEARMPDGARRAELPFLVTPRDESCHAVVRWPGNTPPRIERLTVTPDPLGTLRYYQAWLNEPGTGTVTVAVEAATPARSEFAMGVALRSYRLSTATVRRGSDFALNLYWDVGRPDPFLGRVAVFVHGRGGNRKVAFQGDHNLVDAFPLQESDGVAARAPWLIHVPDHTPPGTYELHVGLYVPLQQRRLDLRRSDLPTSRDGVRLCRLTVTE